jgi:hypothetical protein
MCHVFKRSRQAISSASSCSSNSVRLESAPSLRISMDDLREFISACNYRDLAHGSTARLLCDIWRIAVDCFRAGKQSEIDNIIGTMPQLQIP